MTWCNKILYQKLWWYITKGYERYIASKQQLWANQIVAVFHSNWRDNDLLSSKAWIWHMTWTLLIPLRHPEVPCQSKPCSRSSVWIWSSNEKVYFMAPTLLLRSIVWVTQQTWMDQTLINTFESLKSFDAELFSLWQFAPEWSWQ